MGLGDFIVRRLILLIPTLIGVTLLVFAVVQLLPVSRRAVLFLPDKPKPGDIELMIREHGLDQPVWVQYFEWIGAVVRGNLGWSEVGGETVTTAILARIPATAEIVLFSAPLIIYIGIYLGVLSATNRDKPVDHFTRGLSILGTSLPSFWVGIVLLAIFYRWLGWFAPGRFGNDAFNYVTSSPDWHWYTRLLTIDSLLNGQLWIFVDAIQHLVLPVLTLTIIQIAVISRVMRSTMLETLNKTYIMAARTKGLKNTEIINKHARKNALIPVITLSGLLIAGMMGGLTITETVFSYPGLGNFAARAAIGLDVPTVVGYALFLGIIFVFANLLVDILYAVIDPRIRL
jgi:dipeptide transport system permease protein